MRAALDAGTLTILDSPHLVLTRPALPSSLSIGGHILRIDQSPRVCARFAITHGPTSSKRRGLLDAGLRGGLADLIHEPKIRAAVRIRIDRIRRSVGSDYVQPDLIGQVAAVDSIPAVVFAPHSPKSTTLALLVAIQPYHRTR